MFKWYCREIPNGLDVERIISREFKEVVESLKSDLGYSDVQSIEVKRWTD